MLFEKFPFFHFFFFFLVFSESQRNKDEERCGTVAAPPRVLPRPAQVYTQLFLIQLSKLPSEIGGLIELTQFKIRQISDYSAHYY